MKPKQAKKFSLNNARYVGGRINWDNTESMLPVFIAVKEYPFHARVLAERYGMSVSAVYYRLKQHGVSLTALRNGQTGVGKEILDRYTAKNVTVKVFVDMTDLHESTYQPKGVPHGKKRAKAVS